MFDIGERIQHRTTNEVGLVIGYGHQMVNGSYLTTIKVRVSTTATPSVVEDLYSEWVWADDIRLKTHPQSLSVA